MKILKVLLYCYSIALAWGISSCSEDFLETVPTSAISSKVVLGNTENMMRAVNGIHRFIYSQNDIVNFNAGQQYIMPMAEYGASDAIHSRHSCSWFSSFIHWNRHTYAESSDMSFAWLFYYHIIGSTNNIINASLDMDESETLHNVLGQAYTYRAWAYFNLVRFFAKAYMIGQPETDLGVPIMLSAGPPYAGLSRGTVQEVYNQITTDLLMAIAHFEKGSERIDLSHLDISVAKGIAARVFLTIGDWSNAAIYAKDARQDYALMNEVEYKSGFNDWDNPEWMWASEVIDEQTVLYRSYFYYCSNNFNGSHNRANPKIINHELYHQISVNDYRRDLFLADAPSTFDDWNEGDNEGRYASEKEFEEAVEEYRTIVNNSNRHNMVPYMHIKLSQADGPTISPMDVLHMRSSEMYLIEAEAEARIGNNGIAQDVLYELVAERDSAYLKSNNTGQALVDEILLQRRIELYMEGHRWFDMLRNDEELNREGTGADPHIYMDGYFQPRPSENPKWVFLIPQREIDLNPNIEQNKH